MRAFEHGEMKQACQSFGGTMGEPVRSRLGQPEVPDSVKDIANAFVDAQDMRHQADYDVSQTFTRSSVLALITQVDEAIRGWPSVQADPMARFFLTSLLTWDRLRKRR